MYVRLKTDRPVKEYETKRAEKEKGSIKKQMRERERDVKEA